MARILIVEDHRFFSEALEMLLDRHLADRESAPEFSRATTVAGGLEIADRDGPFALAVVDLALPDGDGADVVRTLKERWPETPVCVLSSAWDFSAAREAGADETISKFENLEKIISRLVHLAAGGGAGART